MTDISKVSHEKQMTVQKKHGGILNAAKVIVVYLFWKQIL